ncbi:MAG: hypothetical protein EXR50_08065 [Dehalococcoidia bacterium]|nr:hypothetical protein [Dehalococcoidia bacterium]
MNFILDENAELDFAAFLEELGHDVKVIARDYPRALSDQEILSIASAEQRVLITNDRDFGELIFRQRLPHSGVIYLRLGRSATPEDKIARLELLFSTHQVRLDQFIVITPNRVRIRRSRQS